MKSEYKSMIVIVAFMAAIAIMGVVTFNRYENQRKAEVPKEEVHIANTNEVEAEIEKPVEITQDVTEKVEEKAVSGENIEAVQEKKAEEHTFSKEEKLLWPIDGNVILNYSMDQTVYFATLDQYKYNPALVISAEVGEPVLAAADGNVEKLNEDARIGETVQMNLGNGYHVVYGQLQEIRVVEGQEVKQGDVIGYINDPSKYYIVEGPNLYFQLLKDGEPENPLEYMEE